MPVVVPDNRPGGARTFGRCGSLLSAGVADILSRYRVGKGIVVDSNGEESDYIDIIIYIYDRHFTPCYRTRWVPEYGRDNCEMLDDLFTHKWRTEEFIATALEQNRREDHAARTAEPVLICDTDSFATGIWHERYVGQRAVEVEELPPQTPSERMSAAFSRLRASASQIKTISNELDQHVDALERALAKLDLRVACWTRLSEWMGPDNDTFKRTYVGYSEYGRRWRIVVQTSEGRDSFPDQEDETTWTFEEAPQYLRVKAVDKLPELVEDLVASVDKTAERMRKKVGPAAELAKAVQTLTVKVKKATS